MSLFLPGYIASSALDLAEKRCSFIRYVFINLGCESAPLLLGLILSPMMEEYLRRALLTARGDRSVFATRPRSASLLAIAALMLVLVISPAIKKKR